MFSFAERLDRQRLGARMVPAQGPHLAAEGSRSLFPAALPGAVGAVDVVEPRDADIDAEVLAVVHAQLFARQLLQAIRILRLHQTMSALNAL